LPAEESQESKPNPKVSVGEQGFSLETEDKSFALRLRTLVQGDGRFFVDDVEGRADDSFLIRRARIELTGTLFRNFEFRLMPDFAPSPSTLLDAWLKWNLKPALQIQAGKVKLPVGLERAQSREYNMFNEFGYPTSLVPNRDVGVNVQGRLAAGALSCYLGVFNGTTDGASIATTDPDDDKDIAFLLFATPFARNKNTALAGLGFGIAGTEGQHREKPSSYRTVGQQVFYSWRNDVLVDGDISRLVGQLHYFGGPFGLLAEYAVSSQELRAGTVEAELDNSAWVATVSWVLTGEDATFRGVKPRRNIDFSSGGLGSWQILARATALDVDDGAFPIFGDPDSSASEAFTLGVGVSWYLNPQVRISLDYNWTDLEGLASLQDENAIILRTQFRF
jgi:phosphate-selective porin OprO/OprP